jgi:hypothetical protein
MNPKILIAAALTAAALGACNKTPEVVPAPMPAAVPAPAPSTSTTVIVVPPAASAASN